MTRLGILVSGRGSNLQAILSACRSGAIDGTVAMVAANRDCAALEIARAAGVPRVAVFDIPAHGSARERDRAMAGALIAAGVDLVVAAGYNRVIDDALVTAFAGRIINIHPSLLPEFGGTMEAIRMALEAGVDQTGVTVHMIEPGTVDAGAVLGQQVVPVLPGDTLESLEARVHAAEHVLLPATIQALIAGRLPSASLTASAEGSG
ncbi:MAG: phosphoribosylglycinamide formyltransferase [Candidatus Dormibacteraeota bacterium]|nr:phosphoribosylglycinamide formyltransferase [Candidatus Dormibacteraeota bacterium]